jgi:cytochrome c-type biogenesis protein CcmE
MKKTHIIGIVVIAVMIMVIISTAGDASTYANFTQAKELAGKGDADLIHVVGKLPKANGSIVGLEESPDKLSFSFILADENNRMEKVIYYKPVPPDFQRSEQIVVIGSFKGNHFVAENILMKCPSKYQEDKLVVN